MNNFDIYYLKSLKKEFNNLKGDIENLVWSRKIYKDFLNKERDIEDPEDFYDFLKLSYVSHMVLGVYRQIDQHKDSMSLNNFLNNLFDNSKKIQKRWFVDQCKKNLLKFKTDPDPDFAEKYGIKTFEINFGKLEFIDPTIIYADIGKLLFYTKEIKKFRNKKIAHEDKGKLKFEVNFNDLDKAIDTIENIKSRYNLLFP